ncbi:DsrE family protein [Bacteroidales bacterium M08MB]|nr:DsrE family protein [Perlabentimonas gracilis]
MLILALVLFTFNINAASKADNTLTNSSTAYQTTPPNAQSDTLVILWTSGDPDVALKMVFMYAGTSARVKWWGHVRLIIWGPSSKLTAENPEIQQGIAKMQENGVVIDACKACADDYGVSDKLSSLGIDVKYMGKPLTEYLKSGKTVLTF